MKLSNKGRYGVRAVFDLAFHGSGNAIQIKDIAERQSIPPRFLEQIFQDLKRAGIVLSKRGPFGGYQLAKPAHKIRIGDILRAVEGAVALSPGQESIVDRTSLAVTESLFQELSQQVQSCLDAVSVEDLCARGLAWAESKAYHPYAYVI